jgi:hypothetical protein
MDVVTLWAWDAEHVPSLGESLGRLQTLAPSRTALGCYLWDYGKKRPMPLDLLQGQCEAGLEWLRQGRIEGLIFLASCVCDLELEAVEWTRKWIPEVADQPL